MDNLAVMPTICLVFLYITDLSQILCTHWEAGEDAEFPKGKENQELQTWPPQSRAERKPMWNSLLACLCSTRFLHSCIQFRTQSVRSCSPHSGWIFLYKLKTKIILHRYTHRAVWATKVLFGTLFPSDSRAYKLIDKLTSNKWTCQGRWRKQCLASTLHEEL